MGITNNYPLSIIPHCMIDNRQWVMTDNGELQTVGIIMVVGIQCRMMDNGGLYIIDADIFNNRWSKIMGNNWQWGMTTENEEWQKWIPDYGE